MLPSEQHDDHDRADDEALVADAGRDLPGRRPAGPAAAAAQVAWLAHAATSCGSTVTASRNSSTSVGCRQAKWVTRPVRSAAASTSWSSVPPVELEQGVAGLLRHDPDTGQRRRPSAVRRPGRRPAAAGRPPGGAAPRRCRVATIRPRARMPTESQSRSTRSSWWLEKTTGTPSPALLEQRLGEGVDADRVQPGERLVEDEHLGPADQGGGELDALLVAQRQLLHRVAAALAQAQALDPLGGGTRRRPRRPRPCRRAK